MSAVINGDSFNGSISVESRARTSSVLERERGREREYPHTVMDEFGHHREICVGSNEFSNGSSALSWFARVVCTPIGSTIEERIFSKFGGNVNRTGYR